MRILFILLLCCSLAFGDQISQEVVGASTDDTGGLTGAPSAATGANLVETNTTMNFGRVVTSPRHAAFRFTSIPIPAGSTIDTIRLTFIAGVNGTVNTCNARFVMEDTGDAATFSDTADYNARSLTTATADWNDVPDWTGGTSYTFPSSGAASTALATVMQEVVDRADWASGNDIVFFLYDNSSSSSAQRSIATWDHTTYNPPAVDIWYTPPAASGPPDHYHGVAGVGVLHSPQGNSVLHKK